MIGRRDTGTEPLGVERVQVERWWFEGIVSRCSGGGGKALIRVQWSRFQGLRTSDSLASNVGCATIATTRSVVGLEVRDRPPHCESIEMGTYCRVVGVFTSPSNSHLGISKVQKTQGSCILTGQTCMVGRGGVGFSARFICWGLRGSGVWGQGSGRGI